MIGWIALGGAAALAYLGLVTGRLHLDLGIGRRVRPLGPQTFEIAAPRDLVFDVIAQPYLCRGTREFEKCKGDHRTAVRVRPSVASTSMEWRR